MKIFNDLPQYAKEVINSRFNAHGINGSEAYNSPHLFTDELKHLPVNDILVFIDKKHIKHQIKNTRVLGYNKINPHLSHYIQFV
tara:strand:+ start:36 stop:287 length:252 start_codon:yes stop_codon:yes gene_type:complete